MFSWHLCTYHISTSRVAASRFFLRILNPRKWCFPGNWNVRLNQKLYHECFRPYDIVLHSFAKLTRHIVPSNQSCGAFFTLGKSLNLMLSALTWARYSSCWVGRDRLGMEWGPLVPFSRASAVGEWPRLRRSRAMSLRDWLVGDSLTLEPEMGAPGARFRPVVR